MKGAATALLPALLVLLALLPAVAAHAVPQQRTPEHGAVLTAPPQEIRLLLTQPAEQGASLGVAPLHGAKVAAGPLQIEQGGVLLVLPLQPLPNGTYLVSWSVVSAADGHPTDGTWAFTVGSSLTALPEASGGDRVLPLTLTGRLVTGAGLLGLGVAGMASFLAGQRPAALRVAAVAFAATALGTVLWLLGFASETGFGLGQAAGSRFGATMGLRSALALVGLAAAGSAQLPGAVARVAPRVALACGLTSLALAPASGHAFDLLPESWGWLVGFLHWIALDVWAGGLVVLAWLHWRRPGPGAGMAFRRFSAPAALSLAFVVATGLVLAAPSVGWNPLAWGASNYGRLLLLKLAFVLAMVVLGGWHLLHSKRWLQHIVGAVQQHLPKTLALEAACGLAALLVAGALASVAPPSAAVPMHMEILAPLVIEAAGDHYKAQFRITPGPAASQASLWRVALVDPRTNQGVLDARNVELDLVEPHQGLGPFNAQLAPAAPGSYAATGAFLPKSGHWRVTLHFSTPEFESETMSVFVTVS